MSIFNTRCFVGTHLPVSQGVSDIAEQSLISAASKLLLFRTVRKETVCTKSCDVPSKRVHEWPGLTLPLKGAAVFSSGCTGFAKSLLISLLPHDVPLFPAPNAKGPASDPARDHWQVRGFGEGNQFGCGHDVGVL